MTGLSLAAAGRPFKVVITGSRGWTESDPIARALDALPKRSVVIVGGALGADTMAETMARTRGHQVIVMRPDWDGDGLGAGHIRNSRMLDERPDLVLAFWVGNSSGTRGCIREAMRRGIPIDICWRAPTAAQLQLEAAA